MVYGKKEGQQHQHRRGYILSWCILVTIPILVITWINFRQESAVCLIILPVLHIKPTEAYVPHFVCCLCDCETAWLLHSFSWSCHGLARMLKVASIRTMLDSVRRDLRTWICCRTRRLTATVTSSPTTRTWWTDRPSTSTSRPSTGQDNRRSR